MQNVDSVKKNKIVLILSKVGFTIFLEWSLFF